MLSSQGVINSGASKVKPLFDQHQSSDCFWVDVCMVEGNCITASRKNSFHGDGRSCTEYSKEKYKKRKEAKFVKPLQ